MASKKEILQMFELFSGGTGGIDSWLGPKTHEVVFERLANIDKEPLSKEQMDQLLILSHEAGVSDDFFKYYWLTAPFHPYDVTNISDFRSEWIQSSEIQSLQHLRWGLYRAPANIGMHAFRTERVATTAP